jgi:hypothetical protein
VIHIHGIQHNVTSYRDGDFFRIVTPGIYDITAERSGYIEMNMNVIHVFTFNYLIDMNRKRSELFL